MICFSCQIPSAIKQAAMAKGIHCGNETILDDDLGAGNWWEDFLPQFRGRFDSWRFMREKGSRFREVTHQTGRFRVREGPVVQLLHRFVIQQAQRLERGQFLEAGIILGVTHGISSELCANAPDPGGPGP